MGSRDIRRRESKKPKKGAKKPLVVEGMVTPPPAEVPRVRTKGKKPPEEEEL